MKRTGTKSSFKSTFVVLLIILLLGSCSSDSSKTDNSKARTVTPTQRMATLTPKPTAGSAHKPTATPTKKASSFEIHYIDVGQGDAALVLCDGKAMLIDGGGSSSSSLIYSYLKKYSVSHLDYIVASHPHDDHVGGLSGALNYATVSTALSPVLSYDSENFNSFVKYLNKQGKSITVPQPGDTFALGSASVEVIGPLKNRQETNNNSLILRIVYSDTSFLFTGDAEKEEEADIIAANVPIKSTVLKVAHHGSGTSSTQKFINKVQATYAVISVGEDNLYEHPIGETLDTLYNAHVIKLYRTDVQGTIICKSNGEDLSFDVERNKYAITYSNPTPKPTATPKPSAANSASTTAVVKNEKQYVLNTSTKKFHYPSCSSVKKMKDKNKKVFTGTRDEVISKGYKPCGNCHP